MYQFKIVKLEEGGYKFELGEIKMFVDDFTIKDGSHELKNPSKAIAYFNFDGNIYGISNGSLNFCTAEAFYDSLNQQYSVFATNKNSGLPEMKRTA